MAQDFGDDMGNALLNFVTRQTENYLRFGRGRERAFDWWQRHYKKEGNTPEQAKAMAEKQSSREQVVVPFGTSEEAAYYAQVCRENGTYAAAYTDKQGNGFLAFAKEDAETVAGYAPQFKDVMARLDEQRITDALNHAEPVNKKTMDSLTELASYPDLPAEDVTVIPVTIRYKDAPEETYDVLFSEQDTENLNIDDSICFSGYSHRELTEMVGRETHEDFDVISVGAPYKVHATQVKTDAPEKTYDVPGKDAPARSDRVATLRAEDTAIHTQNIRNAAQKAREDCTDFSDFERKMNAQGFGVTETSKGEVMAYEPASLNKDGSVPAYERGRDWPVSAETLKNRYDLDVTSFDETTGKAVYDVYLYPAGHATGDMYVVRPPQDSYHNTQVGVQRMHTTITVYKVVKGYIELQKASTCTNVSDNNKLYSLAGAEFSIYDASGKFVQKLTTNEKGDTGRSELLTAGTYTVKETKAPEGYYAADDFTVTVNAGQVTKKTVGDKPYNDPLAMLVGKFDGEKTYNGAGNLPQGSATLADAEFTVDYYDTFDYDNYDELKKADIEPTRSWTFKTNENGYSYFDANHFVFGDSFYYDETNTPTIPRGTIVVRETKAPTGYLKSNAVSFQKIMEGSDISALRTYNAAEVPEQVYRSDFEFTKKAENGSDCLAGVPFKVTSLTTGESHIAVTDENGYFSSASSWNAHDANTNANDWALTTDGTIDSSKLNASAGFWFGNNTVAGEDGNAATGDAIKADNSLGAMPFDTYSVEELRCTANEGYALVNTTVTVSRNGASIDFGTLDDPEPEIHTTAYDASDSDHYIGVGTVKVTDKVEYSHLVAGKTYTVTGEVHDAKTGDVLKVNGKTVTAEKTFTAEESHGSVTVDFSFDSYDLAGKTLVVYETLTDAKGAKLAEHKDKDDVSQQVTVLTPKLSTSAVSEADNSKSVTAEDDATVTDYVRYTGLTAGQTYTLTGTLMDKSTKKAFVDADGNPVTATAEFTAEAESGTATVTFTFDASGIKTGTKLVAFETLSTNGIEIADHKDINDIDQTVTVKAPVIGTTAVDAADGDKTVTGEENVSVRDTVHYNNVTPGKTYKVTGTLYEKVTDKDGKVSKKQLLDADGNPVSAETEFVPEDTYGTVDVTFTFDASDLKAKDKVVAFESLSLNGKELASHADIEDKSQTVTITKPEVGTTAKDGLDGNKTVVSDTEVSVVDTVKYKNVTPGKTYKVSGTLYEKVTDKDGKVSKKQLLDADGNPVSAETEFVPDDTYGTVDVTFTFDGSLLKDNTPVVAFESLSYKDKEIASHSDIEDEGQTVTMHTSEIGTTATDKLDGDKTVIADAESTVTDKVEYDHVLTGKAYTMAGILMDAKTGLPVLTGEGAKKYTEDDLTKFTSGLMNVLGFQSNTYSIKVKDKDWGNGAAIVKNADGSYTYDASERTENEDGTWTVKTDTQTLTEQEDGTWKLTGLEGSGSGTADGGTSSVRNIEETYKADEVEVTDNGIDWSNAKKLPTASIDLAKVKAYAEENKDLLSCLVYKTAEFTPEKESGSIDMDYTFNSNDVIDRLSGETKNLVVFEVMFKGSIENASDETPVSIVASECDKDNEGQTVKLAPSTIGTTATDKSDGDHELMAGKDAVITDEVKYEGLIPGKEYTLHATLMDKKTGEPLKVADKGVTAELKFTPNSESGTVSINLGEFDATSLDGHTLVVFEELTKQSDIDGKTTDVTVAEHKDINDEGQSVTVTSTPAGSTYGKTGVDMTNIAIAIGILLIAAGCATAYGIKSRKTTEGDADESAEDNTEA